MGQGNASGSAEGPAPKEVVAQSFRLVDNEGRTRALLAGRQDHAGRDHGAAIWFYNAAGRVQLVVGVADFDKSARLVVANFEGEQAISLGHMEASALMIGDGKIPQVILGVRDGQGGLAFNDGEGNPQAVMGDAGGGAEIILFDGSGNPIWHAGGEE